MSNKDVFISYNAALNNAILFHPDFPKITASGNMKRTVLDNSNVIATDKFYQKKVAAYYTPIDKGRGKTVSKTGGLWQAIYDWLQYKKYGLTWTTDNERKSIAHAIVTNISKRGSYKFRNKSKQTDIFESAIQSTLPTLFKNIVTQKEISVRTQVIKAYKK